MPAGFDITMKMTDLFFDSGKVIRATDKAERRMLSRAGAFVRTRARSSIRRRKAVSRPGQPPSGHSRDPVATLKNILFVYEPMSRLVVIGPVRLNLHHVIDGFITRGTVPQTLEMGGSVGIREKLDGGRWVPLGRRKARPGQQTRVRHATYRRRPFMGPALAAEAPKFPELFANTVG